jgi:hypothetical protein
MGNVRLYGSTSGYTELAPPAVAPDGVLALPSGTGTLATAAYVDAAVAAGGKVLQVVSATHATAVTTSSSTFSDTGLTATITPSSTSSKILVMVANSVGKQTGNTAVGVRLLRATTVISVIEGAAGTTSGSVPVYVASASMNFVDSPATISPVVYKTQFNSNLNVATAVSNPGGAISSIVLMEVSA